MPARAQLKQNAKEQIKGNIGILFACCLVYFLICGTVLGSLFAPAMMVGFCLIFINMTNGIKPSVGDLFKRASLFGRALWLSVITGFFVLLWTILLIIPGYIKALSYSMAWFVLAENPELTAKAALNESKRIMRGHKMQLFVLILSFIPWMLLGLITLGLAFIYIYPYMFSTITNFYKAIKE